MEEEEEEEGESREEAVEAEAEVEAAKVERCIAREALAASRCGVGKGCTACNSGVILGVRKVALS